MTLLVKAKHFVFIVAQVAILWSLAWVGELISRHLPVHVPGSLMGLAILLVLLMTGVVKQNWVARGSDWLLSLLLLLFVPSVVGVLGQTNTIREHWQGIMMLIISGTLVSLGLVAFLVEKLTKCGNRNA